MSKTSNKVITYFCSKNIDIVSRTTLKNTDFIFKDNNDGTYDVLKNRWNGEIKKGVNWSDCMDLVNSSQRFHDMRN
ncbi:MAG: hypothetical protein ACO3UU_09455 [Minisyncoccia bacterium]|jgi:hypothetical protein